MVPHPPRDIVKIVAPYTLLVAFADGTKQRSDFRPVLRGTQFGPYA